MDPRSATTPGDLWAAVVESLRANLTRQQFETWFRGMRLRDVDGQTATFLVPNDFTREWVETYYRDLLRDALRDHTGRDFEVQVAVVESGADEAARPADGPANGGDGRAAPMGGGAPVTFGYAPGEALVPAGAEEALRAPRPARRTPPVRPPRDGLRGQLFGHSRYPYFLSDVLLNDDYVFEHFVTGPSNQL